MAKTSAMAQPSVDPLFVAKLASSGLTPEDAIELGITYASDSSAIDSHFAPVKGMRLQYHTIDKKPSAFFRIRYLEPPTGFSAQLEKPQRYAQLPKTLNEVYLPPILNWDEVARRPTEEILITEGELKAACAAVHGFKCIALGGVSVWASSKKQVALLEPLPQIDWHGRSVVIIFDSDAAENPNVAKAQIALAKMLLQQGALPRIATLPPAINGDKQGLDDFLVRGGNLAAVLQDTRSLDLGDRFAELNTQYAYVMDQDVVVEINTGRRIKRDAFVNGLMANQQVIEYVVLSNGNTKRVEVRVAQEWLKWPSRSDVTHLTYEPGGPKITEYGAYNTWPGWACTPYPGTVQPWLDLLDHLFGTDEESKRWFQQWAAYPLQRPGTKLFTSVVLWGPETGTGKSLIGYTLGEIYGDNFGEIGNQELHSQFNEWAINKQFILGDEITGSDKRHEADKLKALITQRNLRINMKNMPTYVVPDCINYYFTSNHPDAFFLEDHDRRFFVYRTVAEKRREPEFYSSYVRWLRIEGGKESLFHYLQNYDLTGFSPTAPAPTTLSKLELIDHARSDLSSWVSHFLTNMDDELAKLAEYIGTKPENLDLVLNKHLKWLYDPNNTTRVTPNGLGRELSRFGFKTVPPVPSRAYGIQRFYILRNRNKWLDASPQECADYVDEAFKTVETLTSKF